jgi:Na+/proline symporter
MARISRWVTFLMALFALTVALIVATVTPERTVFWFSIFGWSGIAATFCPVIILSLFWSGYSEKGAIVSMITGFASVPFFKFVVQGMEGIGPYFEKLDVLTPSFLLAMLAGYIVSKIYPPKEKHELVK